MAKATKNVCGKDCKCECTCKVKGGKCICTCTCCGKTCECTCALPKKGFFARLFNK